MSFRKATLSLKVKPQITPDDNIMMKLNVNKDSVGANTSAGPAIDTKQVTTEVLVENGGTVGLGGHLYPGRILDPDQGAVARRHPGSGLFLPPGP